MRPTQVLSQSFPSAHAIFLLYLLVNSNVSSNLAFETLYLSIVHCICFRFGLWFVFEIWCNGDLRYFWNFLVTSWLSDFDGSFQNIFHQIRNGNFMHILDRSQAWSIICVCLASSTCYIGINNCFSVISVSSDAESAGLVEIFLALVNIFFLVWSVGSFCDKLLVPFRDIFLEYHHRYWKCWQ